MISFVWWYLSEVTHPFLDIDVKDVRCTLAVTSVDYQYVWVLTVVSLRLVEQPF